MGYAVAKALKDAGFFQEGRGSRVPPPDKIVARRDDYAYVPTLEELIEACGDYFAGLAHPSANEWNAWHKPDHPDNPSHHTGTTPTEAVARLWLALNSK